MGWDWDGIGTGWDWDGIPLPFLFLYFSYTTQKTPKITIIHQNIIKIMGSTIYFWERSIFAAEKALAATKSHLGWNTQVESNLAPLGFQAGGPTTRLDLGGKHAWGRSWNRTSDLGFKDGAPTTRLDLRGLGGIGEILEGREIIK